MPAITLPSYKTILFILFNKFKSSQGRPLDIALLKNSIIAFLYTGVKNTSP